MGLIDQILLPGQDSRLFDASSRSAGWPAACRGGINNDLGNMFDINGPALWIAVAHPRRGQAGRRDHQGDRRGDRPPPVAPVDQATLDRALVKQPLAALRRVRDAVGFGRADLLASFALFDDDPAKINRLDDEFRKVTPELIQKTAQEYLRPTNRTVLTITPKPAPAGGSSEDH